jgi:hypothetical protein
MNPLAIIEQAKADGVIIALSAADTLKATGDGAAVNRWLPTLREHKVEIIGILKPGAAQATPPMTGKQELAIRAWLDFVDEVDPLTIAEILAKCDNVLDARRYFLERSKEVPRVDSR